MKLEATVKMVLCVSLAVGLFVLAAPFPAHAIDFGDEENLQFVADNDAGNPPSPQAGSTSQAPGDTSPSMASHHEHGRGHWRGEEGCGPRHSRWHEMASRLGLTKEQLAKMRDIWTKYFRDTRDARFDLAEKWLEIHRMLTDPKADAAAIMAKQKELMAIRDRLMLARAQAMVDSRSVLTPEQLEKLDMAMMPHYLGGMGGMHRGMMGEHGMMHGEMMEHQE